MTDDTVVRPSLVERWQIDEQTVGALVREASGCSFIRNTGDTYGARTNPRRVTSPFNFSTSVGGPLANQIAEGETANSVFERLSVRPSRLDSATFVLYEIGAFIGLHTDRAGCDLNLLMLLHGAPTVFECFPSLVETPSADLFEMSKAGRGFLSGGERIGLDRAGCAVAFFGTALPHQRRPAERPLLMLSLCYEIHGSASR